MPLSNIWANLNEDLEEMKDASVSMSSEFSSWQALTKRQIRVEFINVRKQLRWFVKKESVVSDMSEDVYAKVERIILDSNFKYLSLIHYLIALWVPLQKHLLEAIINRTTIWEFKNAIEKQVFKTCSVVFPDIEANVSLWGKDWGVEMDLYIPSEEICIEVDSSKSWKKAYKIEDRHKFLKENFWITSFRYIYTDEINEESLLAFCRDIQLFIEQRSNKNK